MILADCVGELMDWCWHLEAHEQDSLLALNSDVLGPFNKASEISFGLDVPTDSEVAWVLCEQWVLLLLLIFLGTS